MDQISAELLPRLDTLARERLFATVLREVPQDNDIPETGFHMVGEDAPVERAKPDINLFKEPDRKKIWFMLESAALSGDSLYVDFIDDNVKKNKDIIPANPHEKLEWLRLLKMGYINCAEAARRKIVYCENQGILSSVDQDMDEIKEKLQKYYEASTEIEQIEKDLKK